VLFVYYIVGILDLIIVFFKQSLFVTNENPLQESVHFFRMSFQHRDNGTCWGPSVIFSAVLFALRFFPNLHFFPPQVLTQPRSQSERHLAGKYRTSFVVKWSVGKAEHDCLNCAHNRGYSTRCNWPLV